MRLFNKLALALLRILLWRLPMPPSAREFLMWPVATKLIPTSIPIPVTLPNGARFLADMSDYLTRSLALYGPYSSYVWEPVTTRLLERLAAEHARILIAGAHIGFDAVMAARANPNATVVTCEPAPYLAQAARTHASLNGTNITVIEKALARAPGTVSFTVDTLKSRIAPEGGISVAATTIDELGKEYGPFTMALLDIEGHELEALRGARTHLSDEALQDIVFEVSIRMLPNTAMLAETEALLSSRGCTFYRIEDEHGVARPPAQAPLIRLTRLPDLSPVHFPGRYHNVLATRRSPEDIERLVAGTMVQ